MTRNEKLLNNSTCCAEPNCDSTPLFPSSFCGAHDVPRSHSGPLINRLPRLTHFAGKPYAKRGRNPFSLPSARRSPAKSQTSPGPSRLQERAKALESQVETDKVEAHAQPKSLTDRVPKSVTGPVAPKDKNISPPGHSPNINGNINGDQKQELPGSFHVTKCDSGFGGNGGVPSSTLPLLKTNGSAKVSNHAALNHSQGKAESSSSSHKKADLAASILTSNENQLSQGPKQTGLENTRMQALAPVQVSAPTRQLSVNDQATSTTVLAKSPSSINSPHKIAFQHTTSYKAVPGFGLDSTRIPPSPCCESRFGIMQDNDDRSTPEPTSEPESYGSRIPTQESDDEDQSMDLDSPIVSKRHFDSDCAQSVNGRNSPHDEYSPVVNPIISPSKVRNQASRAKRLADFDSAAFDALMYRQSDLQPPSGVSVLLHSPRMATASSEDDRLALPVNPAIHRMHNRSEEWHKKKAKEIQSRGGRKAWFGKTIERQRYLRSREAAAEKERDKARKARVIPPRREPQPRGHKKMLDFGMVPEKNLPDDVRRNPAWLKACAWFRETRSLPQ